MEQVITYCEEHKLLPAYQSAYRKFHSGETTLLKLTNHLLWNMENNKVTSLCAIDLSAAFDTVDHSVLMAVLRDKCKFSDESLDWFSTYLYPRKCRVKVSSDYSKDADLSFSVPQGSVAGLQLFSLYISTLGDIVVLSGNEIHGFADDHVIKKSFTVDTNNEEMSIRALENCLVITGKWMNENRLKMNTSKIEIILIGSRQKISKCNTSSINVCGDQVARNENIKHLGVQMDETLSFRDFSTQSGNFEYIQNY